MGIECISCLGLGKRNQPSKRRWLAFGATCVAVAVLLVVIDVLRTTRSPASDYGNDLESSTAKLKAEFEAEWLKHVAGYTNYTTAGMADDHWDMVAFIKKWRPKIMSNQVRMEPDKRVQELMVDWLLKMNSIEGLYYGMLVPHRQLIERWKAYNDIADATGKINGVELKFKNGRARWMSKEYEDCEMSAVLHNNLIWSCGECVCALVQTDVSANFDGNGVGCDSLSDYWFVRFLDGKIVFAEKLLNKDVRWEPCPDEAPYGLKYSVVFRNGGVDIAKVVDGEVVQRIDF